MALYKFFDTLTNTRGDSLVRYQVVARAVASGPVQPIYGDISGTPILATSGIADTAITDDAGVFGFYITPGIYDLEYRTPDGLFVSATRGVTLYSGLKGDDGNPGNPGAGPGGSIGPFSSLSSITVPAGINSFLVDDGGLMVLDATMTDANVAAYPLAIAKDKGGRYFRRSVRSLWGEQFGAKGDASTDNTAALNAALAYARFRSRLDSAYQSGSPPIWLGIGQFNISAPLDLHSTQQFFGMSAGMELGGAATVIMQTAQAHVFIIDRADTSGGQQQPTPNGGADGSEIAHMAIRYSGGGTRGINSASAINSRARVNLHDLVIEGFSGPGWQIVATSGGGGFVQGEASGSSIRRVVTNGCFVGGRLLGGDANVEEITSCTFGSNDTWGLMAEQFLSCTFINNHFKGNGQLFTVLYNGHRYALMPYQENNAKSIAPGTNPAVWSYIDDYNNGMFPTWVAGGNYTSGGAVMHTNANARSVFISNYSEGGQGLPVIQFPAMSVGGQWAHAPGATGAFLSAEQGMFQGPGFTAQQAGVTSTAGINPMTGLTAHNGTSTSDLFVGPRGNGFRFGLGQGDGDTAIYVHGPGDTNPDWFELRKVLLPGPFANDSAAASSGIVIGQPYYTAAGACQVRVA